jgi:hypothetical protein
MSFSALGSGPCTPSNIAASFTTALADPIVAPTASYSASEIEAARPAPFSTATLAPRAMNFFTVSGEAATLLSPGATSLRTAILVTLCDDQHNKRRHGDCDDGAPFQQGKETRIGFARIAYILISSHFSLPGNVPQNTDYSRLIARWRLLLKRLDNRNFAACLIGSLPLLVTALFHQGADGISMAEKRHDC